LGSVPIKHKSHKKPPEGVLLRRLTKLPLVISGYRLGIASDRLLSKLLSAFDKATADEPKLPFLQIRIYLNYLLLGIKTSF